MLQSRLHKLESEPAGLENYTVTLKSRIHKKSYSFRNWQGLTFWTLFFIVIYRYYRAWEISGLVTFFL